MCAVRSPRIAEHRRDLDPVGGCGGGDGGRKARADLRVRFEDDRRARSEVLHETLHANQQLVRRTIARERPDAGFSSDLRLRAAQRTQRPAQPARSTAVLGGASGRVGRAAQRR
jgi:hypothetical protein